MESNTVVTKLLELARRDPKYLEDIESFRRTVVVMFTDIHGSTAYFEKHGDVAGLLLVHECNGMIRRVVEKHGGRLVKTIGDGSMAKFDDCAGAVAAAVEMQSTLADMNALRRPEEQAAIRVGLHYGSGIVKSNDVFGDVVNVASRVESVAVPGQIVISDEVHELIKAVGFRIAELGWFSLKGKSGERRLLEVLWKKDTTKVPISSGGPTAPAAESSTPPAYKLQVIKKDGEPGAEYPLQSSLVIGRAEGDVRFPSDPNMSARHARMTIVEGQVLVEDISRTGDSVFLRLSAAYTLQDEDTIIMGNQVFRFHENSTVMSAATTLGVTLSDISSVMEESVAEFIHLQGDGSLGQHYPLHREAVEFGRSRGSYTFPEDRLMSRVHARVLQRGEDFVIEDAGSRNGTFVKVRGKALVPPGSAVLVGSRLLKLIAAA